MIYTYIDINLLKPTIIEHSGPDWAEEWTVINNTGCSGDIETSSFSTIGLELWGTWANSTWQDHRLFVSGGKPTPKVLRKGKKHSRKKGHLSTKFPTPNWTSWKGKGEKRDGTVPPTQPTGPVLSDPGQGSVES